MVSGSTPTAGTATKEMKGCQSLCPVKWMVLSGRGGNAAQGIGRVVERRDEPYVFRF